MAYPRPMEPALSSEAEERLLSLLADLLEAALEEASLPSAPTRALVISALCDDASTIACAIDAIQRRTDR